ncbi:MAG TPA: hypothetical protein PLJ21_08550 [Pseudobdellovibrionaceae bacterium]|nr:hypothetical protein [Pseudobdellovibrionaceae bacterium]
MNTKNKKTLYLIFWVLLKTLSGCTSNDNPPHQQLSPEKEQFEGSLYKAYLNLYNEPENRNLSKKCDLDLKDRKLEMMKALDFYQEQIKNNPTFYQTDKINDPNVPIINMDNFKIQLKSVSENSNDEWIKSKNYSWLELINTYENTKGLSSKDVAWKNLNTDVRNLYSDDEDRIFYFQNFTFTADDEIPLKNLQLIVQKCLDQENCSELNLPENLLDWSESKNIYKWYPSWIKDEPTNEEKRKTIKQFLNRIERDYANTFRQRFHLIPNRFYNKTTKELHVKVFGLTDSGLDIFKKFTAEKWSLHGLTIKIENTYSQNPTALSLVLDALDGRSFVKFKPNLRMSLPEEFVQQTLTHEFGHVLGLRDEYYTQWDENQCQYFDMSNPGNIMSTTLDGKILPKHIKAIIDYYEDKTSDQLSPSSN